MIKQISLAGGTHTPIGNYRGSLPKVPTRTLENVPKQIAERGAGNLEQERTLRLFGSERDTRNRMEAAIPCDRPDVEEDAQGLDPSPREIRLRAAQIRAGWSERERQIRRAYRTRRIALQFERFVRLIGQQTTEEGRKLAGAL
ncbi:MAG: hypothetical protein ACLQNE_24785 [Thermoguttaceae bacterium]